MPKSRKSPGKGRAGKVARHKMRKVLPLIKVTGIAWAGGICWFILGLLGKGDLEFGSGGVQHFPAMAVLVQTAVYGSFLELLVVMTANMQ
jgi:hypothetical protein